MSDRRGTIEKGIIALYAGQQEDAAAYFTEALDELEKMLRDEPKPADNDKPAVLVTNCGMFSADSDLVTGVPTEIMEAANNVARWFAERGYDTWALGKVRSR